LLFDENNCLCGRQVGREQPAQMVRPAGKTGALAFSGVHVISPSFLSMISEEGVFSIITSYLRIAGAGAKILAFPADEYYWRDLGKTENLAQAAADPVWQQLLAKESK
jgi:NDP-sugar pyrophosphorylase family protein